MKDQLDKNIYYDPQRQGYDTNIFKTISGEPAIASNKLRLNSASIIGYADIFRGFFCFALTVPATPTNAILTGDTGATAVPATWAAVTAGEFAITIDGVSKDITGIDFTGQTTMAGVASLIQTALQTAFGSYVTCVWSTNKFIITARISITVTSAVAEGAGTDISGAGATDFMDSDTGNGVVTAATNSNKIFGLTQLNKGVKCYFHLRGATLVAVTTDEDGTAQETDITWDSDWTGAEVKYEFDWTGQDVKFKVNGDHVALHQTRRPNNPMSLYINNSLADNFDCSYIEVKGAETLS